MSSPGARQRRRREQYQNPRTRSELGVAIGAGVAIVAGTSLMIWLLRPGGLADRQPRSSWLVALAIIAALTAAYLVLRREKRRKMNEPVVLAISLGAILVVAVVAGIFWPGGLLRHTPKLNTIPPITAPPSTNAGATTSAPAGATTTSPGASTTAPGATTKPTTATTAKAPGSTVTPGATATTKPKTSPTATAPPVSPSQ